MNKKTLKRIMGQYRDDQMAARGERLIPVGYPYSHNPYLQHVPVEDCYAGCVHPRSQGENQVMSAHQGEGGQVMTAHEWPRVPSSRFQGELALSCLKCKGTNVVLTCAYGPGGRLGDPGHVNIIRCLTCKYQEFYGEPQS